MSKSAWGKIGAWADEAERADEEELFPLPPPPSQPGFPSSAATNIKQKKKNKMSLHEFTKQMQGRDDADVLRQLPTAPKHRSPDDERTHFSGFSDYANREGMSNYGRRSQQHMGSDSDQHFGRERFQSQPSRADGVDNWASMKKQTLNPPAPAQTHGHISDQGAVRRHGSVGEASRADDVDSWASVKKHLSSSDRWAGNNGRAFGSDFSSSLPELDRQVRNEENDVNGKKDDENNATVSVNKPNPFGAARPREEVLAEKGLDWKKIDLEIDEKKQLGKEKTSRPTSSQSSRPGSSQSNASEVVSAGEGRQRPKVNPFGDARPREVLLEEKNLDWRKIDLELEHRRVGRTETDEEKKLKEEVEQLKTKLSREDDNNISDMILEKERDLEVLVQQLDDKYRYSRRAYDRQSSGPIRGGDRPPSRPGSSGRPHGDAIVGYQDRPSSRPGGFRERPPSQGGFNERPHSRSLPYEERRDVYPPQGSSFRHGTNQGPRAVDYNGRPRSHGTTESGTGSSWTRRRTDDRRTFQGGGRGGGRGFSSSRDTDRSASRW